MIGAIYCDLSEGEALQKCENAKQKSFSTYRSDKPG